MSETFADYVAEQVPQWLPVAPAPEALASCWEHVDQTIPPSVHLGRGWLSLIKHPDTGAVRLHRLDNAADLCDRGEWRFVGDRKFASSGLLKGWRAAAA